MMDFQPVDGDRFLEASTWTEWSQHSSERPILVVPVGSCEQHGPHLPLHTDTVIAAALCASLAAECDDVVIGPSIPVGNSGEHKGFSGTLSVSNQALGTYLLEIGRSAVATATRAADFSGIIFVSGHGGNSAALAAVVARLGEEGRPSACWSPSAPNGDAHAGVTETSVMLAIAPLHVRIGAMEAGETAPLTELIDRIRESGIRSVSANGILGDPRDADAVQGRALVDGWTRELVAVAHEVRLRSTASPRTVPGSADT